MDIISEKILFTGSQGHLLVGRLDRPATNAKAFAVYAPCFTCTKDILVAKRIGEALAQRGIGMLRIDFTGLGESGGSFTQANFTSNTQDLLAAARFLEAHFQAPELMIGHSLGGTTALVAASKSPSVKGVVTINSPSNPKHVGKRFEEKLEELSWTEEVDVKIEGRDFRIQKQFVDDLQSYDMDTILPQLSAALLVFHAPDDPVVNVRNASAIFSTAVHPKSFISLPNVDHLVTKKEDAVYIAQMIDAWSALYITQQI
ncbi:MAG: alpha/beta hydrolase [Proteobacteria bacterium]|nr:alpha/beta hydrolase [Pseudomonadota bacterium]